MNRYIAIKTSFEAIHCWPNCPFEEVAFLRNPHRHVFHVVVKWPVQHNDRDREFIMAKHDVENFVGNSYQGMNLGAMSCEMIAEAILNSFPDACFCSVYEDDENGAELSR